MEPEKMAGARDGAEEVAAEGPQDVRGSGPGAGGRAPRRRGSAATGAIAVVAAAAVCVAMMAAGGRPAPAQAGAAILQAGASASERQGEESVVMVTVRADGADAGATKVKVTATGSDGKTVVPETEIAANEASEIGKLPKGKYELHVTAAPVCEDGSSYKLPEKPLAFEVDGKGSDEKLDVKLDKIAAADMSKEQLEAASKTLADAGKADAAQSARTAAQSAPSVPGSASSVQRPAQPSAPSTPSQPAQPAAPDPTPVQPSASDPAPAPDSPAPAPDPHAGKTWHEPVYEQQWAPDVVTVVDTPAWDEQVVTGEQIVFSDGHVCATLDEADAYSETFESQGIHTPSYSIQDVYSIVHHDAVTHTEDHGHWIQVLVRQGGWY